MNLNDGEDRPKCRCPLAKGGVEHYRTDRCPELRRGASPEVRDLGALLGHVEAALAVVDRMNVRRAGTVTDETRRFLAHVTAEVDTRLDDVSPPARGDQ